VAKPYDIPEEVHEPPAGRIAHLLAVAMVAATLGIAATELVSQYDGSQLAAAGAIAQQYGVQREGATQRGVEAALVKLDRVALTEEQRMRQALAFQDSLRQGGGQSAAAAASWQRLLQTSEKLSDISPADLPDQDRRFPNRLLVEQQVTAAQLLAQQDAATAQAYAWQVRLSRYAVITTLFAVCLYLFGLGLTLRGGTRAAVAALASVFFVVAFGWGAQMQFTRPSAIDDLAASEYALGQQAENLAASEGGAAQLHAAYDHYSKAIALRPEFSLAYQARAGVDFLLGSPQQDSGGFPSITSADALSAQRGDLQRAYDIDRRTKQADAGIDNDLAFAEILTAERNNDTTSYSRALDHLQQAIALDDVEAIPYYNSGLVLLGMGRSGEARTQYQKAVERTVHDISAGVARDSFYQEALVASALTDLEMLAQHRGDLSSQVTATKELIVAGVQGRGDGTDRSVDTTSLVVTASKLVWAAPIPELGSNDVVSQQWYRKAPQGDAWVADPSVSGVAAPFDMAQLDATLPPGTQASLSDYVLQASQCVAPGSYRVELYVNGHLHRSNSMDGGIQGMAPARLTDLGTALCHPDTWKADSDANIWGFVQGFVSPDARSRVYMLRFQGAASQGSTATADLIDESLSALSGWLPDTPQFADYPSASPYFMDLPSPLEKEYAYSGGTVHAAAGITPDHSVVVALLFKPDDMTADTANDIWTSMVAAT
jgi:hypothetical protein